MKHLSINPERLRAALMNRQWTVTDLSRKSEIAYSTLREHLKGRRSKARDTTIQRMANTLGLDPAELTQH